MCAPLRKSWKITPELTRAKQKNKLNNLQGRAAKQYNPRPANLRKSVLPQQYWEQIVRKGGKAMGRSEFMPPWGEELTEEQIKDIVNYIGSINEKPVRKKENE